MKRKIISVFQHIGAVIFGLLTKLFLRPEISGIENLSELLMIRKNSSFGVAIIANHINALDPFFILSLVPLKIKRKIFPIVFLGKAELFDRKYKKIVMTILGVIPVKQGTGLNIRNTVRRIKNGETIFLFPEGQVSLDGSLGKDSGLVSFFSRYVSFILQPIKINGIRGWKKDWKDILSGKRRLKVHFGAPFIVEKNSTINAVELIKNVKKCECAWCKKYTRILYPPRNTL